MSHHLLDRPPTDWMLESPAEVCRLDVRAVWLATPLDPHENHLQTQKSVVYSGLGPTMSSSLNTLLLLSKQMKQVMFGNNDSKSFSNEHIYVRHCQPLPFLRFAQESSDKARINQ